MAEGVKVGKLLPFQSAAVQKLVREGMASWGKWMMGNHRRYAELQNEGQGPKERAQLQLTEEEARKQAQLTQPPASDPASPTARPDRPLLGWHHRPGDGDDLS